MNYADLMSSFKLMGQSMLAIFIVMALISVIVYMFTTVNRLLFVFNVHLCADNLSISE